jgi:hypothetical protein
VTNLNEFAGLCMDILLQPEKILENSGMFCALWNIVIKKCQYANMMYFIEILIDIQIF